MSYDFSSNKEINSMLNQVVRKINSFVHKQNLHIQRLTKIGYALSSESELDRIFELILEEAIAYTNADGATIYMVADDKKSLKFQLVYNRTLNIHLGGGESSVPWPNLPLYTAEGEKNLKNLVTYVFHNKTAQIIEDVYEQDIFDNSGTKKADLKNKYHSKSMIAIPLKNHEDDVLGIVQLINSMGPSGKVQSFTEEHRVMMQSLASQAAISLTNKALVKGLENLLRQFVKAIAYALDKKSKYSGMHISRVATLTEMFAKKINEVKTGALADVFYSESEWEEISMAGWLHDIGKIVTPEYVMDKSTKLETIFDRIVIIEHRFELVKQVIENKMLIQNHEDRPDNQEILRLEKLKTQLDDDFSFISKINVGGEFLPDEAVQRISDIADFSIHSNGKKFILITEEEKNNLSIRKGTLSKEEIKEMQEHVILTKEILSKLTFPKKFQNVPLYASAHHEKLNGKGYPSGLTSEQLPLPARIIATADIFEALTAADRPYKEGKKLSEALKIMTYMVKDNDLDLELFNLLLDSGLFMEYAESYVKSDQIDVTSIAEIKKHLGL